MGYDPRVHHRRSIRLQGYDYSQEGAYFITICAQHRASFFGVISGGELHPNEAGRMIRSVWDGLPLHYPGVDTDAFQLMPNHLHGIAVLFAGDAGTPDGAANLTPDRLERLGSVEGETCATSLPVVVERFKSLTTTRYREGVLQSGWQRFRQRLWQRNYYEHVIRDEEELNRIRQYISDNPSSWEYDRENPEGRKRERGETWQV